MKLKQIIWCIPVLSGWITGAIQAEPVKAVFTSTNEPENAVVMYERAANGKLTLVGEFETEGAGTGGGLGNQGAVTLSKNAKWLLVTNAASNDVSVFKLDDDGLTLTDVEASGGTMPVSVTIHGTLVYVLNAGGAGNISGFALSSSGDLVPIAGSTRPLSGAPMPAPAQVSFNPTGDLLAVTEKNTNLIDTYTVDEEGLASQPMSQASSGLTPFGFGFSKRGYLIVSEAFMGAPDLSAVSSYDVDDDGELSPITASAPTTETAACWIVITKNGRYTYTTNTGSGTVTGYKIGSDGSLTILDADGVTAETGPGSAPTDEALSKDSKFLYVLNSATGEIDVFKVNKNTGSLSPVQSVGGLPANATGLAAR